MLNATVQDFIMRANLFACLLHEDQKCWWYHQSGIEGADNTVSNSAHRIDEQRVVLTNLDSYHFSEVAAVS